MMELFVCSITKVFISAVVFTIASCANVYNS